jgi:hypothetical protein
MLMGGRGRTAGVDYADDYQKLTAAEPDLAGELAGFRGLGSVLAWLKRRGIALGSVDILPQDEFSLDFVIPLELNGRHLVFGIT